MSSSQLNYDFEPAVGKDFYGNEALETVDEIVRPIGAYGNFLYNTLWFLQYTYPNTESLRTRTRRSLLLQKKSF